MTKIASISKLEVRSHDAPDEVRTPDRTRVELVRLPGFTLGRFTAEPGWRWTECIMPHAGTQSCQVAHVGHVLKGTVVVRMDDGGEVRLTPGDSYTIPPGHDAWVEGEESFVCIEVVDIQ